MEWAESWLIVRNRIKKMEPVHSVKITGYILLEISTDDDMLQLALSPDIVFHELINKLKLEHRAALRDAAAASEFPSQFVSSRPFVAPTDFRVQSSLGYADSMSALQIQTQSSSLDDQVEPVDVRNAGFSNDYFYSDAAFGNAVARGPRHLYVDGFPVKKCHYFKKGCCKRGSNCRYFHEVKDNLHVNNEDRVFSLEKLEVEIVEILKSIRGNSVSIASLPMLYYNKHGKVLRAEGYLTESQRHGKAGYTLTKLLTQLKNSIRLIDRPNGQHEVILAEDAPDYMDRTARNDPGPSVSESRQIYFTFPVESTFTEVDVSNYFSTFGTVENVRFPSHQKRVFGFVTFENADTVKMILAKGNPHSVFGARVLVKPYREKSKLADRKYQERMEHSMQYFPQYTVMASEFHSGPRGYENDRLFRQQFIEDSEQSLERVRRHLSQQHLARKPPATQSYFYYSMDGFHPQEDQHFPSEEQQVNLPLEQLNNSGTDEKTEQDSTEEPNLPDSPFASR